MFQIVADNRITRRHCPRRVREQTAERQQKQKQPEHALFHIVAPFDKSRVRRRRRAAYF